MAPPPVARAAAGDPPGSGPRGPRGRWCHRSRKRRRPGVDCCCLGSHRYPKERWIWVSNSLIPIVRKYGFYLFWRVICYQPLRSVKKWWQSKVRSYLFSVLPRNFGCYQMLISKNWCLESVSPLVRLKIPAKCWISAARLLIGCQNLRFSPAKRIREKCSYEKVMNEATTSWIWDDCTFKHGGYGYTWIWSNIDVGIETG